MPRHRTSPLTLSDTGEAPVSLRASIYRTCLDAMLDGRLAAGDRLPSARALAREWQVSRNTVDDALAALQAEGWLERRVGAGTFVAHPPSVAKAAPQRAPSLLAREALAQVSRWSRNAAATHAAHASPRPRAFLAALPDLDAFPYELWRRLSSRRQRTSGRQLAGYLPSLGLPALQAAIARHLRAARAIVCEPQQVLVLNSTMQAADLVARVLVDHSQHAWIEDPSFPNLRAALAVSGARLVPVPVDGHGVDVAQGIARSPRAALAYVTPACHYPLGVTMAPDRRRALLDWSHRSGAWIVEDDYQGEFVYAPRAAPPLAAIDRSGRVIHVGTFSNTLFPSLRLAYVVLPPALVDVFAAVRGQLDDHTHGLAQAVLADFIDGGYFAAHLRRMRQHYAARRDAIVAACRDALGERATVIAANAGMSIALRTASSADARLADTAMTAGIAVLPLSRYAVRSRSWRGLLLGYAAIDEAAIRDGVRRLASVLDDRHAGRPALRSGARR